MSVGDSRRWDEVAPDHPARPRRRDGVVLEIQQASGSPAVGGSTQPPMTTTGTRSAESSVCSTIRRAGSTIGTESSA
jgi:hypothetical protein